VAAQRLNKPAVVTHELQKLYLYQILLTVQVLARKKKLPTIIVQEIPVHGILIHIKFAEKKL